MPEHEPTLFESLAALSRLVEVEEFEPGFYARFRVPIDMAIGFIRFVGSHDQYLDLTLTITGVPLADTAANVEQLLRSRGLPGMDLAWFDDQMTIVMQQLLPMYRDPELPYFLHEHRWAIEGAFVPAPPSSSPPSA